MTNGNARFVAQICQRLDGIPLAIELAAARTRALSVEEIAHRLDERFRLLTGGSWTAPPRQQTLRAAMDWSYNLLTEPERLLLQRLAVFVGGWTLQVAEAACNDERLARQEILEQLTRLVDKSLVVLERPSEDRTARYHILETIREYAREKLSESGEEERWRQHHFDFFLQMATEAEPKLFTAERGEWFGRLELEYDNLRAALHWIATRGQIELQLQMVGSLVDFWYGRGYFSEGRSHLAHALSACEPLEAAPSSQWLAKSLYGAGLLAWMQTDLPAAIPRLQASAKMWRDLGNHWELSWSLVVLGWIEYQMGNYSSVTLATECATLARESGNDRALGLALTYLGTIAFDRGDFPTADRLFVEAEPLVRNSGDQWNLATTLTWYGHGLWAQGDFDKAMALDKEALALYRQLGERWGVAWVLHNLGQLACTQKDYTQANANFKNSLAIWQELGNPFGIRQVLAGFSSVALSTGRLTHAARLLGATDALFDALGAKLIPLDQAEYERNLAAARTQLDADTFAAAWEEGRALKLDQAIALALADE